MLKPSIIVSERLILRPFSKDIINDNYLNWLNDDEITSYLEINGFYTLDMLANYVNLMIDKNVFIWAIFLKDGNKHIGNIKIDPINTKHKFGEYGIMIGARSEWGKGYAFEASSLVLNYCFQNLFLRKVCLGVINENIAAISLYKKLGFKIEGIYKSHLLYNDQYSDCIRMAAFNPTIKF